MTEQYPQSLVARTVWPWQQPKSVVKAHKPSLLFSLVTLGIALAISGAFYGTGHPRMAMVIACIASFIFVAGQFMPPVYQVIETAFQRLSHWVGTAITWLTLVPFFYICFGFGRLVLKMRGKDPMKRKLEIERESYWFVREGEADEEQYRRQF